MNTTTINAAVGVRDRNGIWHLLRADEDTTLCGRDVPAELPRTEIPSTENRCRPCETTRTSRITARDHLAEARAALAAARRPEPTTP